MSPPRKHRVYSVLDGHIDNDVHIRIVHFVGTRRYLIVTGTIGRRK